MFGQAKGDERRTTRRSDSFSVIGADVVITGDLASGSNLQVDGTINGNVRCGALHQAPGGAISGDIEAEEARLAGLVDGRVVAGMVVLQASARITGDIIYEKLCVEGGARIEGRLRHRDSAAADGPAPSLFEVPAIVQAAE